jgi:hypothetical protein
MIERRSPHRGGSSGILKNMSPPDRMIGAKLTSLRSTKLPRFFNALSFGGHTRILCSERFYLFQGNA